MIPRVDPARFILAAILAGPMLLPGCDQNTNKSAAPAPANAEDKPGPDETPRDEGEAEPTTALDPELVELFRMIGRGDMEAARRQLVPHLEEHPADGQAEFLLGLSYHQEFRYGAALPHFERARELAPMYHPIHHFTGWCLYYLGEPAESRAAFERHLELMPREGDSHYALGLIAQDSGDLDAAEDRFRQAIELQREMPHRAGSRANAHVGMAEIQARRGRLDDAERELRTAVSLVPNHDEAWFQLYRVLTRLDRPDEAAEALKRHESILARQSSGPERPSP